VVRLTAISFAFKILIICDSQNEHRGSEFFLSRVSIAALSRARYSYSISVRMSVRLSHANIRVKTTELEMKQHKLECGPMPNLMAALPNIGGALCSTPQSLADAHY